MPRSMCNKYSVATALTILAAPRAALAHHGNDPAYHQSMPTQITAGGSPLCFARYDVRRRDVGGADHFATAASVPCIGVDISFSEQVTRWLDVRLRFGYTKPFAASDLIDDTLHEFRVTLAPELLVYRLRDRLTLTIGPEFGFQASLFNPIDSGVVADSAPAGTAFADGWALGWETAIIVGVRGWVTYHAGLWVEVGTGHAHVRSVDATLDEGWLGRLTLGWADRF